MAPMQALLSKLAKSKNSKTIMSGLKENLFEPDVDYIDSVIHT